MKKRFFALVACLTTAVQAHTLIATPDSVHGQIIQKIKLQNGSPTSKRDAIFLIGKKYVDQSENENSILYLREAYGLSVQNDKNNGFQKKILPIIVKANFDIGYIDSSYKYSGVLSSILLNDKSTTSEELLFFNLRAAEVQMKRGFFIAADSLLRFTIPKIKSKLSSESLATLYYMWAVNSFKNGEFDSTLRYVDQYLKFNQKDTLVAFLKTTNLKSQVYLMKADIDKALELQLIIKKKLDEAKNPSKFFLAQHYINIGKCYTIKAKYRLAMEMLNYALAIYKQAYNNENHINCALVYDQLAVVYHEKSDYGKALEFAERSLAIKQRYLNPENPDIADSYNIIGDIKCETEQFDACLENHNKALEIRKRLHDTTHIHVGFAYNNFGLSHKYQKNYKTAEGAFSKTEKTYNNLIDNKKHYYFGKLYNDMGEVSQGLNQNDTAVARYLRSIDIYLTIFGKRHPEIANGYLNIGELCMKQNRIKEACYYLQKAIMANVIGFDDSLVTANPPMTNIINDFTLIKTLASKALAVEKLWDEENRPIDTTKVYVKTEIEKLLVANQCYFQCSKLIDRLRASFTSEESKLYLSQKTALIFENATELSIKIADLTADKSFKESAVMFSEKGKAGSLLNAINESNAKKVAGIPDSLLANERVILSELSKIQIRLAKEQKKGPRADQELVDELKQKLNETKNNYSELIAKFEKNYPKYYNLKYSGKSASVTDIQNQLLGAADPDNKSKTTLIQYMVGENSIFIILITAKTYELIKVKKDARLNANVYAFRNGIIFNVPQTYSQASMALYKQLIAPIKKKIIGKDVFIIPDGVLSYIPFEALIMSEDTAKIFKLTEDKKFNQMPYLNNKYNVKYCYSATLAIEMKKLEKGSHYYHLLGLAPIFSNENTKGITLKSDKKPYYESFSVPFDTTKFDSTVSHAKQVEPIPSTDSELRSIMGALNKFGDISYMYENQYAQESILRSEQISLFKYIHFATHGMTNSASPELSGLYFADDPTKIDDGILHSGEIYNLKLNCDLTVLSACETGLGRMVQGEGLIGLSRSLIYAGTRNLIVSLWKVNDASTGKLMSNMYQNIFSQPVKPDYAIALAAARKNLIKNPKTAFPYYWAPFVLIGN